MKKFMRHIGIAIRQNWKKIMESSHRKLSRGAEYFSRMFPWGRGDQWRRRDKNKNKK